MDKSTLSNYGWIVIVTLVLAVMLAIATPFGSFVARGVSNVIKYYKTATGDVFSASYMSGKQSEWEEYLNNDGSLTVGIGKTKSEYVIAVFNKDHTKVTIKKNGENSDGLMKDFSIVEPVDRELSQYRETLKEVIVEEGVVSIGKNAFNGFNKLTTLKLPNGLKIIDFSAFNGCDKLAGLKLPETIEYLGDYAFYTCRATTEVDIPATVNYIGSAAFGDLRNCPAITVNSNNPYYNSVDGVVYNEDFTTLVQYPAGKPNTNYKVFDTTKLIMAYGFAGNFFIEDVILPEGLKEISWYAFSNTALKSISLPSTLNKLGSYAFRYSKSLKSTITIPKALTNIGASAFSTVATEFIVEDGNPNYKAIDGVLFSKDGTTLLAYPAATPNLSYTVPTGVTKIGEGAFLWTQYTQEIILPNTVTTIDAEAFNNFVHRQAFTVTIPESVKIISKTAFREAYYATIKGKTGSMVETFANENNITFIAI